MAFDAKTNWKYDDPVMEDDFNRWEKGIKDAHNLVDAVGTDLATFKNRRDNPHSVTKGQVGLGNVDNVKQASKAEFDSHANNKSNPHNVTSEQVNFTSYRPATDSGDLYPIGFTIFFIGTDDTGYPTAHGTIVNMKYNNTRFTQWCFGRGGVGSATVGNAQFRHWYTGLGWSQWFRVETTEGSQAKVDAHTSLKNNPHAVTKAQVGLGNVDNVKQASKADFDSHNADTTKHITSAERTKWNAAEQNAIDWAKSFGIGTDRATYLRDDDLNVVREGGLYYVGANTVNKPTAVNGFLLVLPYTTAYTAQIYLANGTGSMYTRVSTSAGSTWEAWKALETTEGAKEKAEAIKYWAQGFGLGSVSAVIADDLNIIRDTGFYVATNPLNKPGSSYYHIVNIRHGSNNVVQYAASIERRTDDIHFRVCRNNIWGEWIQQETTTGAQAKANKALSDAKSYAMNTIAVYDGGKIDPNTTQEAYILTNHENCPGSGYWHIHTYFYSSRTSNRAQTAVSYSGSTPLMMVRHLYNGTWSSWEPGVPSATLSAKGIVQLSSATNSTSTTLAATPSAVKAAYDLALGRETPAGAQAKADKALNDAKSYFTEGTGWQKPTLLNGYTEGDAAEPLRYKRCGNLLFLQVTAYGTAYGTSKPMFTLPEGYRPEYSLFPPVTLIGNYKAARGFISKDGGVGLSSNSTDVSGMTGVMLHIVVPLS